MGTSPSCAFTCNAGGGTGMLPSEERWVGWGERWRGKLVFLPKALVVLLCSYSVAPSFKGFSLLIAAVHY